MIVDPTRQCATFHHAWLQGSQEHTNEQALARRIHMHRNRAAIVKAYVLMFFSEPLVCDGNSRQESVGHAADLHIMATSSLF